jgi:long-subunit acyl-CoA synthetase (AMP-forming)
MNAQEVLAARKKAEEEKLEKDFTYHAPKGDQVLRYQDIRDQAKQFAAYILATTMPSREQSLALTKLEESVFWANAAIARNE